ncbi:MAG: class I SAM-dependent methyltransferase, partial [Ferruginibacter sp.]
MNEDLIFYYKQRAKEYENIYLKPERQDDLKTATTILQETFIKKDIFEIGCGTGYWTEKIGKTASSILATDINETVVEIARKKDYKNAAVTFGIADFYSYEETKKYEGLFGGFIWSHIPVQHLYKFLFKISKFVLPGGTVVFMDYNYEEGSNRPIT